MTTRPDRRPMVSLPMLEARRTELETCAYCPKLCRSACPVSNAEPRETLTPWGKMTTAYLAAQGDVPLEASFARPAWACTGCGACTNACDHRNDVASSLTSAREAFSSRDLAPEAAQRMVHDWEAHATATRSAVAKHISAGRSAIALLVGCTYSLRASDVARDAVAAVRQLVGQVEVIDMCCGKPLKMAGARARFDSHAAQFAARTRGFDRLVVADPGCAVTFATDYREAGVRLAPRVSLLVDEAAAQLGALVASDARTDVRYHEPCSLGRILGRGAEARAVLTTITGRPPAEVTVRGGCSGGGGLLPVTMPAVSQAIAVARVAEHDAAGGGELVTACASSLVSLRRAARGQFVVSDLATWIARALRR